MLMVPLMDSVMATIKSVVLQITQFENVDNIIEHVVCGEIGVFNEALD